MLLPLVAAPRGARADAGDELARARAALEKLGYTDARALLDTALKQGGHDRSELLEIYALRGEAAAVLDGAGASETEFRKLLVLDPSHAPPGRESPTFRVPFDNAKAWVNKAGTFRVEQRAMATSDGTLAVAEQVTSDPLAMAASVEVEFRANDTDPYAKLDTTSWQQAIPVSAAQARYVVVVLDRFGNTLVTLGSTEAPLRFSAASTVGLVDKPEPPRTPSRVSGLGLGLLGGGAAGAIAGAVLLGQSLAALNASRHASTQDEYTSDHNRSRIFDGVGGALLGVGGALVVAGTAVLAIHAHKPR